MRIIPGMLTPKGWICQTCKAGAGYLRWELIHGHCSCLRCGHPYMIREKRKVRDCLKSEFRAAAKLGWREGENMRTHTKEEWERLQGEVNNA